MVVSSCARAAVVGQRAGRSLKLGRGRSYGFDDLSDRAFERVGEPGHRGHLFLARGLFERFPLGLHAEHLDRVFLEHQQARAIDPISSRRCVQGTSTDISPPASLPIAAVIWPSERTTRLITIQSVSAARTSENAIRKPLSISVRKLLRWAVSASRAAS